VSTILKIFLRFDGPNFVHVDLSFWFTKFKRQSTWLPLFHLKSVMLDHFIAKNATAHKVNSY